MLVNKKVEAVADILRMKNPDFSVSQSYSIAKEIVDKIDHLVDHNISEPTG